jgi:hypothetical protein
MTYLLRADRDRRSDRAASEKLPCSTTFTNARMLESLSMSYHHIAADGRAWLWAVTRLPQARRRIIPYSWTVLSEIRALLLGPGGLNDG